LCSSIAAADPLLDNLDQPIRGVTILGSTDPDRLWAAQSFGTPTRVILDSIEILLGEATFDADAVFELHSGIDPTGPLVATFTVPAMIDTGVEITMLVPDTAVLLDPNELYWLVLGCASTGSFGWAYAEGNDFTGTGYFGSYNYSSDSGATWANFGGDNPYHMRVTVSPPPACVADVDDGSGTGTPDGGVGIEDLLYYLSVYDLGTTSADVDDGTGTGTPDGGVGIEDLLYYLSRYDAGC
jgi:hypothetical protein